MVPLSITISILWNGTYICTVIFILLLYYGTLIHNHIYTMVPISILYYGNYIYAHIHTLLPIPKPIPIYGTHIYTLLWHPYLSLVLISILCFQYLHCATLIHTHIYTMVPISIFSTLMCPKSLLIR